MKPGLLLVAFSAIVLIGCKRSQPPPPPIVRLSEDRMLSISSNPKFIEKDYSYLTCEIVAPDGTKSFSWPENRLQQDSLDENHAYEFDLVEYEHFRTTGGGEPPHSYWITELVRVHDGDSLLYDASICTKHQIQMDRKMVKIGYGLPSSSAEWKIIGENAPNSGLVWGGCCIIKEETETRTWVCPTCKSIYDEGVARMKSLEQ